MGRFAAPSALVGVSIVAVLAAACTAIFTRRTPEKLRAQVVKIALAEPSKSPRVQAYWKDVLKPEEYLQNAPITKDWCGVFILWALHQAGLGENVKWEIGKGFFSKLTPTKNPQPGDIAYFTHNQHEALVKSISGSKVNLINGNGTNGWITQSSPEISSVTAFYSIDPLIAEVV
jgi:hypothetical protein